MTKLTKREKNIILIAGVAAYGAFMYTRGYYKAINLIVDNVPEKLLDQVIAAV